MKLLSLSAVVVGCLCAVASVLTDSGTAGSVQLPVPGKGWEVRGSFWVPLSGQYFLEVAIPTGPVTVPSRPLAPGIETSLQVGIDHGEVPILEVDMSSLHPEGRDDFGHLEFFRSEVFSLGRGFDRTLRVKNLGDTAVFQQRGGTISIQPFGRPTERHLLWALIRFGAVAVLPLGVIGITLTEVRNRRAASRRS